jgi:ABC-2 type transport system permease protein
LASIPFVSVAVNSPLWTLSFGLMACLILGSLGLIAALYAEKWDHVSAFQNFLINPLTFLAGVFYSVQILPEQWQFISHLNPFFYLIDGFRFGVFGQSDVSPWLSASICGASTVSLLMLTHQLIASGWRIRN